jgi:hypothetical protein
MRAVPLNFLSFKVYRSHTLCGGRLLRVNSSRRDDARPAFVHNATQIFPANLSLKEHRSHILCSDVKMLRVNSSKRDDARLEDLVHLFTTPRRFFPGQEKGVPSQAKWCAK